MISDCGRSIIRPDERIQAHIFVAFLSYCLLVTLKARLRRHAGGLTPRSVLEELKAIQMLDVTAPTTDGRYLTMTRYTQPDAAQQLILARLGLRSEEHTSELQSQ